MKNYKSPIILLVAFFMFFGASNDIFADTTTPFGTFTPSSVGWTNSEITAIFTPTDEGGSGVYRWRYQLSNNSGATYSLWSEYIYGDTSLPFIFYDQGIHVIRVVVEDNSGNSITLNSGRYEIDKTIPSGSFGPSSGSWSNSSISTSFNPSDSGGSGVYQWRYRISTDNGLTYGSWSSYIAGDTTQSILLTQEGENKIQAEVFDNAGNAITLNSGVYYVDNTPPSGTFSPASSSLTNNVDTIFSPSDSGGSGVDYWQYRVSINNGATYGSWSAVISGETDSTINLSENGVNKIQALVYDKSGHSTIVESGTYDIDSISPSISSISTSINKVSRISFTISPGTDARGVNRIEYKLSGSNTSTWRMYTGKVTLYKEGLTNIEARTVDNAGNYSEVTVEQVEIEKPTAEDDILIYPTIENNWVGDNIELSVHHSGSSDLDGLVSKEYELSSSTFFPTTLSNNLPDGGRVWVPNDGVTFIHVRYVFDNGVTIYKTDGPYKIDTSTIGEFEMSLTDSSGSLVTGWTTGPLELGMTLPAGGASEIQRQYKLEGYHANWLPYDGQATITPEGKYLLAGRIINEAGTVTAQKFIEVKIDNTKPSFEALYLREVLSPTEATTYEVIALPIEDKSGIQRINLDNSQLLKEIGNEDEYHIRHLPTKPNSIYIQDVAGNVSDAIPFLELPTVNFQNGYNFRQYESKEDVEATLNSTDVLSYNIQDFKDTCYTKPCSANVDKNTDFIVTNTRGFNNSQVFIPITNIDKKPIHLTLQGLRDETTVGTIHFEWNLLISNPVITCYNSSGTVTYTTISGTDYTVTGAENEAYECILSGTQYGESVVSNTITVYPDYVKEVLADNAISILEKVLEQNVYIEETRYGTSYFINLGKNNSGGNAIPLPDTLF